MPAIRTLMVSLIAIASLVARARAEQPQHLVYAFSTYDTAHVAPGAVGVLDGPGTGTMTVDIRAGQFPKARSVTFQEWWWHELRPEQARSCVVEYLGRFDCGLYPLPSEAELALLPFLATETFDALDVSSGKAIFAGGGSYGEGWIAVAGYSNMEVEKRSPDDTVIEVLVDTRNRQTNAHYISYKQVSLVTFDALRGIPLSVHSTTCSSPLDAVFTTTSVDLVLVTPARPFGSDRLVTTRNDPAPTPCK